MRGRFASCVAMLAVLVGGASGCGLKGSLELPSKSSNVVIRGPGAPATDTGTTAPTKPPSTTDTPETPAGAPATGAPSDERLPPPPLPGGNSGSARGG
jgi:predicted small lipoprotein YifL